MTLKALRQKRGLTQMDLAARSGVTQTTISHLELHPERRPSFDTAFRLAKALEVRPEDIFAVEEQSA